MFVRKVRKNLDVTLDLRDPPRSWELTKLLESAKHGGDKGLVRDFKTLERRTVQHNGYFNICHKSLRPNTISYKL